MIFEPNTTLREFISLFKESNVPTVMAILKDPTRLQITYGFKVLMVNTGDEVRWNGTDFVIVQKNYYKGPMGEAFQPDTMPVGAWPEWAERMWDRLPFDNYSICMHNMKYFVRFEGSHSEISKDSWLMKTANGEIKLMSNNRFKEWKQNNG